MIWIILFLRRRLGERAIGKKQAWSGRRTTASERDPGNPQSCLARELEGDPRRDFHSYVNERLPARLERYVFNISELPP
jgi:hypothetical protein